MTVEEVSDFYKSRILYFEKALRKAEKKITSIALMRIAALLSCLLFAYLGIQTVLLFIPATLLFCLFLFLVKQHSIVFNEKTRILALLSLNRKESAFHTGDKTVFAAGEDIDHPGHLYALDLDIFGKGSLFQAINRSATLSGRNLLVSLLLTPLSDKARIEARRDAIRDLRDDPEWRQEFNIRGSFSEEKENDRKQIASWLALTDFFERRGIWKVITVVMSVISFSIISYCIITSQLLLALLFAPLVVNNLLMNFVSGPVKLYFAHFGNKTKQFRKYADLFDQIGRRKFSSPESEYLQSNCTDANVAFRKLFELSNLVDQRANPIVPFFMNGFFLFDLWIIYQIEEWRRKNSPNFDKWIESLITIDVISSFANFSFNHPDFSIAVVETGKPFISAKDLAHPLMPTSVSVKNDYQIGMNDRLHVITGSNMAGKSTFIRAVGLNLVLACNGVPVCAGSFSCSVMGLITSIRISDSLEENASYFKAEITRLDRLIGNLKTNQPFLVLLDEILRGTNSDDKRLGTQSFLVRLKQYNCIVLLASHDLGIGKLEQEFPGIVSNYCFESQFTGDTLTFDYRLRKGVSSTTNATFLMKSIGLID